MWAYPKMGWLNHRDRDGFGQETSVPKKGVTNKNSDLPPKVRGETPKMTSFCRNGTVVRNQFGVQHLEIHCAPMPMTVLVKVGCPQQNKQTKTKTINAEIIIA